MDWRRGGGGRPRGFGDSTWRGGGASAEAPSPPRPRAVGKPAMGATMGAKFKNPPTEAAPAPAAKLTPPRATTPPAARAYSPVSGGTTPEIFLPRFGAKFGGKGGPKPPLGGKKGKPVPVDDIDEESIQESILERDNTNIPDTSISRESSLYDVTDQTMPTAADNYDQQEALVPPMSPPMFERDVPDYPEANTQYENERAAKSNRPTLLTQYEEEEEDYTEFVKQQETMMFRSKERQKRAEEAHRNPLVDEYDDKRPATRKAAPFGDYIKNQESESEAFYTPNVSIDQSLNKVDKRKDLPKGKERKLARPSTIHEVMRNEERKGGQREVSPKGRHSAKGENDAYEEDEEFVSAFNEQSARTSAVFISQDLIESDQTAPLTTRAKGPRDTKGRKEVSPLPFSQQGNRNKSLKSDGPPMKGSKRRATRDDVSDESLEEGSFEDAKVASSPATRQRTPTEKGRRSATPSKMKGEMLDEGQQKGMKKATVKDDENDDPGAKKRQMEILQSKKRAKEDPKYAEDSADDEIVEDTKHKKGSIKSTKKKSKSADGRFSDDEFGRNMSTKSQKTSSRSTTPSRASKARELADSASEESDTAVKLKNKKGSKLQSSDNAKKSGKLPKQPVVDHKPTTSKRESTRIKDDESEDVAVAYKDDSKKHPKGKTQFRTRSPSPKYASSEEELNEGEDGQPKRKKRPQQKPLAKDLSSDSQATDGEEALSVRKKKKMSRKQTAGARSPTHESGSAKLSSSSSTDPRLQHKDKHGDRSDDKTDSLLSTDEAKGHLSQKRGKGKSKQKGREAETDSSITSLTDTKLKKKAQNKKRDASSESHLSLKDEDVSTDGGSMDEHERRKKKIVTDSDNVASEEPKMDKRPRSKSPTRKTPTGHLRTPSTPDESDKDKGKKHGRKEMSAVVKRQKSPGRKLVSDDSLENVKQKVDKQSRRVKADSSSFPSSDQTQTDMDEDDSVLASKSKAQKPSNKGTKGKNIESLLDEKGKDKRSKSHGRKEPKVSPRPVEQKSKNVSKDTSPRTAPRETKPSKQSTLKTTAQDAKTKPKSTKVSKKEKSEELSEDDDSEKSSSSSEDTEDNKNEDRKAIDSKTKGKKKNKKGQDPKETEAELLPVKEQTGKTGSDEIAESKIKHAKHLGDGEVNKTHEMETQIEDKTFLPGKKVTAVELQASEASIFASQRPKPVGSTPVTTAQTAKSVSRKFVDIETGVQSEDFVNISKQRLPTTNAAASVGQFGPKESLPKFRESLRRFLSKDVQTPIAKRIQTTPSVEMSEESLTWEEYSANIIPKYQGKLSKRDKAHKSIGIQQSVRKLGSDESTSIGTEVSECNVRHGWLDEVLKQLQSIAEDKGQSSGGETSPEECSQMDVSEEESLGGYSCRCVEDRLKFQYAPISETSFPPRRQPTEESVFARGPQVGSSIATVCPDPDKFVQVINISMLPSRIVAVEVTQDIGDGSSPPPMPGKLEFDEPTTALTFNVPLMEACQGDYHPVTDDQGKPWPQASTQRQPTPVNIPRHSERSRKSSPADRRMKSADVGHVSGSSRRQRGASTRHQRPVPVQESPRQQRPDVNNQRGNQPSPADILLSRLAQRLAWKSQ